MCAIYHFLNYIIRIVYKLVPTWYQVTIDGEHFEQTEN